ncbi:MAG: putative quinol monooxygenase [Myxococcales bacterium]|jgi:quinol monooxygenase YgiN|nr:antibiotic biosynthesis monooxygenase [Myxococcales bacterium]
MPSVIATIKVRDDKVDEARSFLKNLAAETLANESGTLAYIPHQHKDDPSTFTFYEKYENDEAFKIHGKNLASRNAEFAGLLSGPPKITFVDEL